MRRHKIIKVRHDAGWQRDGSFQPDAGSIDEGLRDDDLWDAIESALLGFTWVEETTFHWKAYRRELTPDGWGNVLFAEVWVETMEDDGIIIDNRS